MEEIRQLQEAHTPVRRKLTYYNDIKRSLEKEEPLPNWKDYKSWMLE